MPTDSVSEKKRENIDDMRKARGGEKETICARELEKKIKYKVHPFRSCFLGEKCRCGMKIAVCCVVALY